VVSEDLVKSSRYKHSSAKHSSAKHSSAKNSTVTGETCSYLMMTVLVSIFCTLRHLAKGAGNDLSGHNLAGSNLLETDIARLVSLEDPESKLVFGLPVSLYDTDETLLDLIPKVGPATAKRLIKNKFEISKARCHSYEAATYTLKQKVKLSTPQAKQLPKFIEPDGCSIHLLAPPLP